MGLMKSVQRKKTASSADASQKRDTGLSETGSVGSTKYFQKL